MSDTSDSTPIEPTTPTEIEADLERQRAELSETVDQLQQRLDVKSRAQEKATELKDRATTDEGKPRPEVAGAAGGAVALLTGLLLLRRRRRRRKLADLD